MYCVWLFPYSYPTGNGFGSSYAKKLLSPSKVKNLLQMPSGCSEQTSSALTFTVLALRYLDLSDQWFDLSADARDKALKFIELGRDTKSSTFLVLMVLAVIYTVLTHFNELSVSNVFRSPQPYTHFNSSSCFSFFSSKSFIWSFYIATFILSFQWFLSGFFCPYLKSTGQWKEHVIGWEWGRRKEAAVWIKFGPNAQGLASRGKQLSVKLPENLAF